MGSVVVVKVDHALKVQKIFDQSHRYNCLSNEKKQRNLLFKALDVLDVLDLLINHVSSLNMESLLSVRLNTIALTQTPHYAHYKYIHIN